ncbi:MAG: hypothetical protein WB626_13060 [Bacteroidota bacterium]
MIRRSTALLLILAFPFLAAPAGVVKDGTLSATSDGVNITVRWVSEDEGTVGRYELERKSGLSGSFLPLATVPLRGNNTLYEYVDETAFRIAGSIYQYQLRVTFHTGQSPVVYGPITVRHDVSSVRKTWGSIKAMFR